MVKMASEVTRLGGRLKNEQEKDFFMSLAVNDNSQVAENFINMALMNYKQGSHVISYNYQPRGLGVFGSFLYQN
jgi:hypothetical protein